ncbi:hypothetical protein BDV95DRAFT_89070 [Massariosphaeria phaeospora]|uniref:Uncharacterized protein n=1 Tax=Massariosphaeria phaeospora TaxID=100035 RepID=A0A7C8MLH4_9PLEO|nr:hypothetical protein BDV95DRAFT_89070 [Massariosphaeria phaeospora]
MFGLHGSEGNTYVAFKNKKGERRFHILPSFRFVSFPVCMSCMGMASSRRKAPFYSPGVRRWRACAHGHWLRRGGSGTASLHGWHGVHTATVVAADARLDYIRLSASRGFVLRRGVGALPYPSYEARLGYDWCGWYIMDGLYGCGRLGVLYR